MQQEWRIDNYDDESDETTATALKIERFKKRLVLEYTDKHGVRKELPPELTN